MAPHVDLKRVIAICALTFLGACKHAAQDKDKQGPSKCAEGERGCPCAGDTCDDGLTCMDGFCVPEDCQRGQEGCACNPNGSCDVAGDTPLACMGNICVAGMAPEDGAPGAACGSDVPCGEFGGVASECESGVCELPGCPAGMLACPCGPYGACFTFEGKPVRCASGSCSVGACTPGSTGCECRPDSTCDESLSCRSGFCRGRRRTVVVGNDSVRACEALLDVGSSPVAAAVFATGVRGSMMQRPPRLAIAFGSQGDVTMRGEAVQIDFQNNPGAISISEVTCVDETHSVVGDPAVALQ